jgi:hypothetical protein
MAAVTVTNRRENVSGSKRMILATLAGSGSSDTWATGLKLITAFSLDGGTVEPTAASVSGGTVTISAGGAYTGVSAVVWGY